MNEINILRICNNIYLKKNLTKHITETTKTEQEEKKTFTFAPTTRLHEK